MITLYKKDGATKIGDLTDCIECLVEEERNGMFEVSLVYPSSSNLCSYLVEENIIKCNANDTLLNQKFRIYLTRKAMDNTIEIYARHISFDLMYDYIDNVSFENQSCEYALNQLFRNSNFSKHYRGYSDIINAQDYNMSMANVLEAIGGKQGSIIDTYGTGAEILRDNENIHVLNKRGYDNDITIEYRKNLTGFELEEDITDLVTRILPYAKYNDSETNEEIIVKADYIDSPLIANYSHPYISHIDYSDRFEEDETPTVSKLQELARKEFKNNKVDIPKQNFKIEFIPLSKCVGYEGLNDRISLCDTVTIKDTRYNIDTQAKVIKTVFNVLKNRYESMELGEPKTSLGDVIGGSSDAVAGPPGPQGPQGPPGEDGNIGDFPNTLPSTPVLESFVYGFSNIELSWTFENKVYYSYELYGSKTKDFKPNTFDLIFEGQASTYMFQAKPNETWYFRVCAINTHGERTNFSNQVTVTTTKIEDLSNYVENMAISEALIGTLSLDRGWVGKLNANLLDVKGNFSVTDGNGKRTLDIDSFGNVNLAPSVVQIGFNGINKRISINERSMDFIASNGNRDMLLYGGQTCIYNNMDNTFMATIGSVLNNSNTSKGTGFLLGKNCDAFVIGRDATWTDILDNRSPNPVGTFFINFKDNYLGSKGIHLRDTTYTTHDIVGMNNPSVHGFYSISSTNTVFDTWRSLVDNTIVMRFDGGTNKIKLGKVLDGNGFVAENFGSINTSRLYIDNIYAYNGNYGKLLMRTDGWNMYNGVNWDWYGHNLLNPVIIGGSYGYSITPNADTYSNVKTYNDNINLDGVLDKINIYPTQTTYKASSERSLEIDVTELRESENADMFIKTHNTVNSETGESEIVENIDMKSMLHLALLEIKKLKEEVKALKMKVGV